MGNMACKDNLLFLLLWTTLACHLYSRPAVPTCAPLSVSINILTRQPFRPSLSVLKINDTCAIIDFGSTSFTSNEQNADGSHRISRFEFIRPEMLWNTYHVSGSFPGIFFWVVLSSHRLQMIRSLHLMHRCCHEKISYVPFWWLKLIQTVH